MRKIDECKEIYRLNGVEIDESLFHKIRVEGTYDRISTYMYNNKKIFNIDGEAGVYGSLRGGVR